MPREALKREPDIRPYRGKRPQIAVSAYIDPAAVVIGDVVIGEECIGGRHHGAVADYGVKAHVGLQGEGKFITEAPSHPGILYECQNKGLVKWAIRKLLILNKAHHDASQLLPV